MARYFGLSTTRGAFVTDIEPNGPAARAGLQTRDLIVQVGDESIRDEDHLRLLIARTPAGTTVPLHVFRQGAETKLTLTLEARRWQEPAHTTQPAASSSRTRLLGLTVVTLTADAAAALGLEQRTTGLLVVDVKPDSVAGQRGVKPSDVILEINEVPVSTAADVRSAVAEHPGVTMLRVARAGGKFAYHFLPR